MTEEDVVMQRLCAQAQALACGLAQEVKSRKLVVLPATGGVWKFRKVEQARSWLRGYLHCGRHGRRCFVQGCRCGAGFNGKP